MLSAGQKLAQFEVVECLGVGGMGEVYRARDTRLGREVALKVIRTARAGDADSLARFEREARLLAALNHPHIGTLYGLEEAEGVRFLVLELVPGPTLSEQLRTGPLTVSEACRLAQQLADALEVAHEKGIIHRDLKPANLKLSSQGNLKVLDFGLGKLLPAAAEGDAETPCHTGEGVILGTPAYMSPEQARGEAVDSRADVWAFGCVVFEMLAGKRAFAGTTLTEIIAAIFEKEPDWRQLPRETPPPVRETLMRCLRKNPERRLRDIRDVRVEMEEGSAILSASSMPAPRAMPVTPPPVPGMQTSPRVGATTASSPWLATTADAPEAAGVFSGPRVAERTMALPAAGPPLLPPSAAAPSSRRSKLWLWIVLAVVVIGGAGGGLIWWFTRPPKVEEPDPFALLNRFHDESWKTFGGFLGKAEDFLKGDEGRPWDELAVLPFETPFDWFNGKEEAEHLAAILTDELARDDKLSVISHAKVRGEGPFYNDPLRTGRNLRANQVLTGKISRRGEQLNVQVELVESKTGTRRWGKTYDWDRGSNWQGLARVIAADAGVRLRK